MLKRSVVKTLIAAMFIASVIGCASKPKPVEDIRAPTSDPTPTRDDKPIVMPYTGSCAAELLPQLPSPVPLMTIKQPIPVRKIFGGSVPNGLSLMDLEAHLSKALIDAGYSSFSYHGAGCHGFAVMPEFEEIEANGKRKSKIAVRRSPFDLAAYFEGLFAAPYGYYRQIIFVVTDVPLTVDDEYPLESELRTIQRAGASALPNVYSRIAYEPSRYRFYALIYEFEKDEGDTAATLRGPKSRLSLDEHLVGAGIFQTP
jgi:hypothetical protein